MTEITQSSAQATGPVYEVTLTINADVAPQFDAWLSQHVDEMLTLPGFVAARVYALDDDDDGHVRRVTLYTMDSDESLQHYFDHDAPRMRQSGIDKFGEQFSAARRILRDTGTAATSSAHIDHCSNCQTELVGQYCGSCGQRARSRLISLWELIQDAFGDLFEVDSRLWRTLRPLLFSPGQLTRDYLQGRRARFMPPFRTYIVLSILFFLVLLFDPQKEFGIFFEPEPELTEQQSRDEKAEQAADAREQVLRDLAGQGLIALPADLVAKDQAALTKNGNVAAATDPPQPDEVEQDAVVSATAAKPTKETKGLTLTFDGDGSGNSGCDIEDGDMDDWPTWLTQRLSRERLQAVCDKVSADDGKNLLEKLKDKIPAALFFLLPLMAFVLKLNYPLSKRYYVEHLLFVVHYHAFIFLLLSLMILGTRVAGWMLAPEALVQVTVTALSFYVPVYLYKSMRRVYGQGHLATIPKYLFLTMAYIAGVSLIFAITVVLAAFSI